MLSSHINTPFNSEGTTYVPYEEINYQDQVPELPPEVEDFLFKLYNETLDYPGVMEQVTSTDHFLSNPVIAPGRPGEAAYRLELELFRTEMNNLGLSRVETETLLAHVDPNSPLYLHFQRYFLEHFGLGELTPQAMVELQEGLTELITGRTSDLYSVEISHNTSEISLVHQDIFQIINPIFERVFSDETITFELIKMNKSISELHLRALQGADIENNHTQITTSVENKLHILGYSPAEIALIMHSFDPLSPHFYILNQTSREPSEGIQSSDEDLKLLLLNLRRLFDPDNNNPDLWDSTVYPASYTYSLDPILKWNPNLPGLVWIPPRNLGSIEPPPPDSSFQNNGVPAAPTSEQNRQIIVPPIPPINWFPNRSTLVLGGGVSILTLLLAVGALRARHK